MGEPTLCNPSALLVMRTCTKLPRFIRIMLQAMFSGIQHVIKIQTTPPRFDTAAPVSATPAAWTPEPQTARLKRRDPPAHEVPERSERERLDVSTGSTHHPRHHVRRRSPKRSEGGKRECVAPHGQVNLFKQKNLIVEIRLVKHGATHPLRTSHSTLRRSSGQALTQTISRCFERLSRGTGRNQKSDFFHTLFATCTA